MKKCVDCGSLIYSYGRKSRPVLRCRPCWSKFTQTSEWRQRISSARKGKGKEARFWFPERVGLLRTLYGKHPVDELAQLLGCSTDSVTQEAWKLKLKENRRWRAKESWDFLDKNPFDILLSKTDIAYIAGIFDGEGSVSKNCYSHWRLQVGNTYEPLIDWLVNKILYSTKHKGIAKAEIYKTPYVWRLCGNLKIKALLELLLPYLTVKQKKAGEVINAIVDYESKFVEKRIS